MNNRKKCFIYFGDLQVVAIFAHGMRKLLLILVCWAMAVGCQAQVNAETTKDVEVKETSQPEDMPSVVESPRMSLRPIDSFRGRRHVADESARTEDLELLPETQGADSLHLPLLNSFGQAYTPIGMYPIGWGGWYDWQLHKGLNVQLGASVFGFFGNHAPSGAGFQQNVTAMYAQPVNDKLSFAVGGYLNSIQWNSASYTNSGLSGVLSYKFNDRWEASIYGHKSLMNNQFVPLPLYYMSMMGDCVGAAVKYNVTPSFYVQLSVDRRNYPLQNWFGHDSNPWRQPDNPLPPR